MSHSRLQRMLIGRHPLWTLVRAIVLAGVCIIFFGSILRPAWTDGESMEPTVPDGRLRFINLRAYRHEDPQRGDVVAIHAAGKKRMYLKRILGLPGETVAFDHGALLIDGSRVPEPYVRWEGPWQMTPQPVGSHEYFVAGDNRRIARELQTHGLVRRSAIVGRLVGRSTHE